MANLDSRVSKMAEYCSRVTASSETVDLLHTRKAVRRTLDIWPPWPIVIDHLSPQLWDVDDIVAALECNDRVCDIDLKEVASSPLHVILAQMHVSFPELTQLTLLSEQSRNEVVPVVPNSFLGGSAPRLRSFSLGRIPFPGLPKLLLSATNLVHLSLSNIPHSGYISPKAMATCLSTLTRLNSLGIRFSAQPLPHQESRRPPPPTRSVLPALKDLRFVGVSEYLEDLVARIDAHRLFDRWHFEFVFPHQITLDIPQLAQFLSRIPKLKTCKEADAILFYTMVAVRLYFPFSRTPRFFFSTTCDLNALDQRLSFLAQVFRSSLSLFPSLKHFSIVDGSGGSHHWRQDPDDFENNQWLEILRTFTTAENLYLSKEIVPRVAPTLELVTFGKRLTEVLPSLQNLFLERPYPAGSVEDAIGNFSTARRRSGRPIVIHDWDGRPW